MAALSFPLSSTPGARPGEGLGRLINAYVYKEGEAISYAPAPGLVAFAVTGQTPRGFLLVNSTLFIAVKDQLLKLVGGVVSTVGALGGSGLVTMARNNKVPTPDVVIVADGNAFITDGASVSSYPDPDVGSPNSVAFLDAYFVFGYGDGTVRASDVGVTVIDAESFTKAEAKPDGVTRVITKGRQVIYLGPNSAEFNDNAGTSPFPFTRSEVVDTGLFGPWAVAGFEDGWDKQWFMVASDRTVRRWDGYTPTPISTRDVERSIATVTDPATLTACVYTFGGNSVLSLSGPDWTWEYHTNVGQWFERESYGLSRWRGQTSVFAFGRWLVGDIASTSLMAIDESARREGADPLVWTVEGWTADFPRGARLNDLRLDFSTGQGRETGLDPIETDPRVAVSWSLDGGGSYGTPVERSIGRQGQYGRSIRVNSLGRSQGKGVKLRLSISDPVPFAFKSADLGQVKVRKS